MAKKVTLKELLTNHTDSRDDIYVRLVIYPLALPVTWYLVNFTSISANAVTVTGLGLGLAGASTSMITQQMAYLLLGFFAFFVCDFVDGQIASVRGGTYLGAILDLITDRTVLLSAILCLAYDHVLAVQHYELFLLLCYLCAFTYVDVFFLAKKIAASKHVATTGREISPLRSKGSRKLSGWSLLPTRLSSPLLFAATLLITESYILAYYTALACVASEYVTLVVKTCLKGSDKLWLFARRRIPAIHNGTVSQQP